MRSFAWILGCTLACSVAAAGEPVLELTVGEETFVGRAVAHDDHVCWLAHSDGRLSEVALQSVSSFRQIGRNFQGQSALEARNELREQFGREWEIIGTGHYLVAARKGRAREHAEHFENLYRSFRSYFTRRGFRLPEPDFPLIAVVFGNQREFAKQCRSDQVPLIPGLKGYYHRKTNRIALFEAGVTTARHEPSRLAPAGEIGALDIFGRPPSLVGASGLSLNAVGRFDANIQGSLKDTIVHEATHQVAYNLGLHSRVGKPPRWTVEGLATMFEAEGTRQNTGGKQARSRVNEERFWWFGMYRQERREPGSLGEFVATDDAFKRSPLDFYAEAWALTFYLAETRPRDYAGYLKAVAERDPLRNYSARDRLADFQAAFGSDLGRLEIEMLRFYDNLN